MEKTITNNIPIEIYGETGTGKELVAKAIHFNSLRKSKPYIALNVAAFPKELIESELFGYEKGAFTGALLSKPGKLEEANGGTLFLDEISEMDPSMQAKLLRAIQEMEINRLGSNKSIKLNFRIITASHKNLLQEVKEGRFREDLYYRLMGMKIELPPLRKRGNDILVLANHFISNYAKWNKLEVKQFSEEAKSALLKYRYPGNVRELKAITETAYVMSDTNTIQEEDLQLNEVNLLENILGQHLTLEEYNIKIIEHFLQRNNQNVLKTAQDLGIGKTTVYRYINEGKIHLK
jgi:transcriptional regulator with PAS, ATPase and Fis domain